jgi:hypothetical protein
MKKFRKVYKLERESEYSIVGIEINGNFYLENIKGQSITVKGFLQLTELPEIQEAVKDQAKGRIRHKPFNVFRWIGMSGCIDYYIRIWENSPTDWSGREISREHLDSRFSYGKFPRVSTKYLAHISMFDKLNQGLDLYILDYIPVIESMRWYMNDEDEDNEENTSPYIITELEEISASDIAAYCTPPEEENRRLLYRYGNFIAFSNWNEFLKESFSHERIQATVAEGLRSYLGRDYEEKVTEFFIAENQKEADRIVFLLGMNPKTFKNWVISPGKDNKTNLVVYIKNEKGEEL